MKEKFFISQIVIINIDVIVLFYRLCSALDQNNEEKNVEFLIWSLATLLATFVVFENYHESEKEKISVLNTLYDSSDLDAVIIL